MFHQIMKRKWLTAGSCLVFLCASFFIFSAVAQDDSTVNPLSAEEEKNLKMETLEDFMPGVEGGGQRFLYEPEGRRDPFKSLLGGKSVEGIRPAGIEGMNISELVLIGILDWGDKGKIALFKGTDNKTYQRKVGEAVFDGEIFAIEKGTVTFKQKVYDVFGNEKPSKMIPVKLHPKKEEGL
ncbi:hypothetical protein ACFL27_20585 [candidate division CSSED10-310 bacterium]|uniref:Pilus assembly protein PilP n=1 Tax=candidate division CSSED10-310 bacterium TaxID=2855610 RepID=A0ABV6Z2C1_UNCC1